MRIPAHLRELETELEDNPDSESRWVDLLAAYCADADLSAHPRRVHHIVEYVRRFPESSIARCPYVHLDPGSPKEHVESIERVWMDLLEADPKNASIIRGLALFLSDHDHARTVKLLELALQRDPDDAELWVEAGRASQQPAHSLHCFLRGHELGSTQPNLLVWIGRTAIEADDVAEAERAGKELLRLADDARRRYGQQLDWRDSGHELFERARTATGSAVLAGELVTAIGQHSHQKHWGHTVLGLVALQAGNVALASEHLKASSDVVAEPRLSAYGPATTLAQGLCNAGQWDAVLDYLTACEAFWDSDELAAWRDAVAKQQLPGF